MAKKLNWFVMAFFLSSFLVMGLASAATTLNTPAASTTVGGATIFNVTFTDFVFGTDDFINLTFYAGSTLTANTSWTVIGTNNSLNGTSLLNESLTSIDLTDLLEDANNYIFNVTSTNSTGGTVLSEDTNTGMIIDQTIPQAPSSLSPSDQNEDSDGSITFSATVTGANTTSCTLRFPNKIPPGGASQSMVHSGNTCTLTLSSVPQETYDWFVRASDETNTTDSSTIQVTAKEVNTIGSAVGQALDQTGQVIKTSEGFSFSEGGTNTWIIGIIVVAIIIFFVVKKK